jgi:hypothetical protein
MATTHCQEAYNDKKQAARLQSQTPRKAMDPGLDGDILGLWLNLEL